MSVDFQSEGGIPYQSVPTYSDPYQDILSEDAVVFAPDSSNNGGGVVVVVEGGGAGGEDHAATAAAAAAKTSPSRSTRSSSIDRLERGERDPLLSTGT